MATNGPMLGSLGRWRPAATGLLNVRSISGINRLDFQEKSIVTSVLFLRWDSRLRDGVNVCGVFVNSVQMATHLVHLILPVNPKYHMLALRLCAGLETRKMIRTGTETRHTRSEHRVEEMLRRNVCVDRPIQQPLLPGRYECGHSRSGSKVLLYLR